jgi:peptide/nickel transport system substrate-binding protein
MTKEQYSAEQLIRRRILLKAAAFGTAGAVSGVSLPPSRAQAQAPKRGGIFRTMVAGDPPLLVLGLSTLAITQVVSTKIYEGLVSFDPKLNPLPQLAKSWTISPDKKVFAFKLQENAKWHDGKPFTSEDVDFSIASFQAALNARSKIMIANIDKIEMPDLHTVVFTLKQSFEPFIYAFDVLNFTIVPKHIYSGSEFRTNPANQTPIGTGPFKLKEWRRGTSIELERFKDYWNPERPYLDGITYQIIADSSGRSIAMQTGQAQSAQIGDIEAAELDRFRAIPNLEVSLEGWEYMSPLLYVGMNHRSKPLDDARFRRALCMAIDRDLVSQRIFFGAAKPATSPIPSTIRFHDPSMKLPAFDPAGAIKLLEDMGLRSDASGVRAKLRLLGLGGATFWDSLNEYLKQALSSIGVQITVEVGDAASYVQKLGNWDYDLWVNWGSNFADPSIGIEKIYVTWNIQKIAFTNTDSISDPEVDKLFLAARVATTMEERQKLFTEVQKLLIERMDMLWIAEIRWPTIVDKRVHNVTGGATGVLGRWDDVFIA